MWCVQAIVSQSQHVYPDTYPTCNQEFAPGKLRARERDLDGWCKKGFSEFEASFFIDGFASKSRILKLSSSILDFTSASSVL